MEKTSLPEDLFAIAQKFGLERTVVLSTFAGLLSNIVSNVPAVLVFKPFISRLQNPEHSWLTLAMSTTLAGNLTLLGSVANLIVVQKARHQVQIGFWEYFRTGGPLAIVTIAAGVLLLG
jgi:Na+/H+ antiporter NhaD/arsenite permease-like protein